MTIHCPDEDRFVLIDGLTLRVDQVDTPGNRSPDFFGGRLQLLMELLELLCAEALGGDGRGIQQAAAAHQHAKHPAVCHFQSCILQRGDYQMFFFAERDFQIGADSKSR